MLNVECFHSLRWEHTPVVAHRVRRQDGGRRGGITSRRRAMRLLFVHERFGAMAGAEVNAYLTATGLKRRGHIPGLVHGAPTGKGESGWREIFSDCYPLAQPDAYASTQSALREFAPDA